MKNISFSLEYASFARFLNCCRWITGYQARTLAVVGLIGLASHNAQAQNFTWSGATDNTFGTNTNWVGGTAPTTSGTNNNFFFTGSPTNASPTITGGTTPGTASYNFNSITFEVGAQSFVLGPLHEQIINRFIGPIIGNSTLTQLSSSNQTVNTTIVVNGASNTFTVSGNGTGSLALNSIRYNGGGTMVLDRSASLSNLNGTFNANNILRMTGATNPTDQIVTIADANLGPVGTLYLNALANSNIALPTTVAGPTLVATNAAGLTTNATIFANSVTFGGNRQMTFSGNLTMIGNGDKTLFFTNNAATGTTLSGNALQFGVVSGTASRTITLDVASGARATLSGNITGSVSTGMTSLLKSSAGTLILSGANTYNGTTIVSGGTLLVNNTTGSGTGSGNVNVSTGGALGGGGIIAGAVSITGSLRPGQDVGLGIGTLTVGNPVTWNSSSNADDAWIFQLGLSAADLAGAASGLSTQDLLEITAGNFFKGTTGGNWIFDFAGTGEAGWYQLVDWTGSTDFVAGDFTATNLASGLTGTFIVDATTSALYLNVVPEPRAALLGSLGLLALLRRRR